MRRHHGEVQDLALQELVKTLGISIHVIPPNDERESFTLFTAGLSDRAMSIPRGSRDDRYIELFVDLPPDWDLSEPGLHEPNFSWPIEWLRQCSALLRQPGNWLRSPGARPRKGPTRVFKSFLAASNNTRCPWSWT